ncbi:MAG: bifunctional folylpolyglutamate synthase/dihydrofolate synthase [Flavobacteriales bacterium]|nr:bifunctional folylpolyglutamate synthase/dihydrofolate synthase [Flavobacteriales bacterium]
MNYQESLQWLYSQVPNYQKQGNEAYKPGLRNIHKLMDFYGNPHKKIKTIHIAGTNGKGSTSHSVCSILQEAGYKVGLFTSPHLINFTERIRINGKECGQEFIHREILKLKNTQFDFIPSFFELTTAFAFTYFAEQKVDVAVIEVGLGGRLDATNIIIPEITAITSISYDHKELLGDTLEQIAKEKAGIIKQNIPVVIGEKNPQLVEVISTVAKEKEAKIIIPNYTFRESDLKGNYQNQNQNTTLGVIYELKNLGWEISEQEINNGLKNVIKNTNLRGRWEILQENPIVICDTGHNESAFQFIVRQLIEYKKNLHFLLGFVKGKDVNEIISLLPKNANYTFTQPTIPRALNPNEYEDIIKKYSSKYTINTGIIDAYKTALKNTQQDEILFVGGSSFVVADILEFLENNQ